MSLRLPSMMTIRPLFVGMGHRGMHGGHAGRAIGFIECRLKLDRRDERGDDIDDVATESMKCLANAVLASGKPLEKACRKFIGTRVDAHDDRVAGSLHRLEQSVDEVHESLLRFGLGWVDTSGFDSTIYRPCRYRLSPKLRLSWRDIGA